MLTTFKKPWEESPPSSPLTEGTDGVYRPEFFNLIEKQSPDCFLNGGLERRSKVVSTSGRANACTVYVGVIRK